MSKLSSLKQHRRTLPLTSRFQEFDNRHKVYSLLFVAVILARAMSWPISLIDPDEYAFILSGREVMHGHLPYTTFFDIKPVGSSLLLAFCHEHWWLASDHSTNLRCNMRLFDRNLPL